MPEVYHIVSPESDFVLCSCGSIMVDVTARGMERRQYRCLHCGNVANEPETPNSRARILPPRPQRPRTLRDYQRAAVDAVKAALGQKPILVAPTGSGKTVMGTTLARELNLQTLWLAHREELILQAAQSLRALGIEPGIIKAGIEPTPDAQFQVASVQTLARRRRRFVPGLIVIDECHHARASQYGDVLAAFPDAKVVGLTATPFRLDGRGLGDIFGTIVVATTAGELCARGLLVAPTVYCSETPDLRGLRMRGGDFGVPELVERMNRATITGDIVETYKRRALGRRAVCFAVDVAHPKAICAAMINADVNAEHLDGSMERDARAAVLARLKSGKTEVVCNCEILTEGWDLPALEVAIIARPTASLNLHIQMVGRVMRKAYGKAGAVVLDHAGNHHTHGSVLRPLAYSLDTEQPAARAADGETGLHRCWQCGLMYDAGMDACPECATVRSAGPSAGRNAAPVAGEGELVPFEETFAYRQRYWQEVFEESLRRGFTLGWARGQYRDRFGAEPVLIGTVLVDPQNATETQRRTIYEGLTREARGRGYRDGWASYRYREIFGTFPRGFVEEGRSEIDGAARNAGTYVGAPTRRTADEISNYLTRRLLEPFRGCNDLCVAKNGDVYFTDQAQSSLADAYGRVYCLRAATGKLDLVLDKIPSPNGLVLNKSENALYLAVTRANQIWKINFNADGSTGKVGIFIQLSGGHGPDAAGRQPPTQAPAARLSASRRCGSSSPTCWYTFSTIVGSRWPIRAATVATPSRAFNSRVANPCRNRYGEAWNPTTLHSRLNRQLRA